VDRRGHRRFMYRRRGALALVLRRDLPSRRGRADQSQFAARKHPNANSAYQSMFGILMPIWG
jgi:hypothetical protein